MTSRLLILGASARAAAFSACRAGLSPYCGDLFADVDLSARCPVRRASRYPHDLETIAAGAPPGPWIYTGGLENHPELISRVSASRPLLGNSAPVLRRIRDPHRLAQVLRAGGLDSPEVATSARGLPRDGSWLRKGYGSSGGSRVQLWRGGASLPPEHPDWYYQRRVDGTACSAVYVAADRRARLLGLSQQRLAPVARAGGSFGYAGSVGPLGMSQPLRRTLTRMGELLSHEFQLVGLFGVDLIVAPDESVWPVEVNPRFPASVEVLERAGGFSAVGFHVAACGEGRLCDESAGCANAGPTQTGTASATSWSGKAIVFARRQGCVSNAFTTYWQRQNMGLPRPVAADLPSPGTVIQPGQPVMTALADGPSRTDVEGLLRCRWHECQRQLDELTVPPRGCEVGQPRAQGG